MLTCFDIANYFLVMIDEDSGDFITNLKLQKLVYYAQGFWLALKDKPLFLQKIEAWTYGPVISELYYHYKDYGSLAIPYPDFVDFAIYSEEVQEILDQVHMIYGQFSAWKLRDLTHEESTWRNHYNKPDRTIPHDEMRTFL